MNIGPLEVIIVLVMVAISVIVVFRILRFANRSRRHRPCARCGERVKNGVLDCPHCGFDFRTIGAPAPR
ncbi:MAG TPA: hypothetical protein VFJ57_04180 [Solirubrobacterales bacterium]|nr:hypothetical protein [Solirubrobacterales bacterium]